MITHQGGDSSTDVDTVTFSVYKTAILDDDCTLAEAITASTYIDTLYQYDTGDTGNAVFVLRYCTSESKDTKFTGYTNEGTAYDDKFHLAHYEFGIHYYDLTCSYYELSEDNSVLKYSSIILRKHYKIDLDDVWTIGNTSTDTVFADETFDATLKLKDIINNPTDYGFTKIQ